MSPGIFFGQFVSPDWAALPAWLKGVGGLEISHKAANFNTHFLRSFFKDLKKGLCTHSEVGNEGKMKLTYMFGPIPLG